MRIGTINNIIIIFYIFILFLGISGCNTSAKKVETADSDFTMVVFPDPQYEVAFAPSIWLCQNQWVVDHQTDNNIKVVMCVGDVADNSTDAQYKTAKKQGFDLIDAAGIPFLVVPGNHDYTHQVKRNTSKWDQYFGPSCFSGKSWYVEGYPSGSNANVCLKIDIGSYKFLILGLEFFPRNSAVSWAQSMIDKNSDRQVIIVTHAYLRCNGKRFTDSDTFGPNAYGLADANSGQELWDSFIKKNMAIFLVICGHDTGGPYGSHRSDLGTNGSIVHQIYGDYQCATKFGNGYILLLKFKPSQSKIVVSAYCTNTQKYSTTESVYTLSFPSP